MNPYDTEFLSKGIVNDPYFFQMAHYMTATADRLADWSALSLYFPKELLL